VLSTVRVEPRAGSRIIWPSRVLPSEVPPPALPYGDRSGLIGALFTLNGDVSTGPFTSVELMEGALR
jgi:hypothetical protein